MAALVPVEAHVASLVLNAISLDERGKGRGHTAEDAAVAFALALLDFLPLLAHLVGRLDRLGSGLHLFALGREYVGMAEDEFVAEFIAHICDVKASLLAAYLGVEGNVQEDIAQLLADIQGIVLG